MAEQETDGAEIEVSAAELDPETLGPRERAAFDVIAEICQVTGLEIHPRATGIQGPYLHIEIVGEDAISTYGRNGKSLDALQYLANLIIGRKAGGDVRVLLDAANYRARREKALEDLAREYAALVKERQEECELDPLPAHERRIIHNILADDDTIRTYSEGDDPDRRVIIAPR